jgi:predicted MPP superfamily phosphohydrolase
MAYVRLGMARLLFFLVVVSMWLGMHVWLGRRLTRRGRRYPAWANRAIWGMVLALVSLPMLAMFGRRYGLIEADLLSWIGYMVMGAGSIMIAFTIIVDVSWLAIEAVSWLRRRRNAPTLNAPASPEPAAPTRRQFFADLANYGIVGGAVGLSAVGFAEARRVPRVVEVDVPIADLHPDLDGLRIVQLTDVHIGPTIRGTWLDKVIEAVNELDADLVALTGDFVDGSVEELGPELGALARIRARHGSYFVTGNHEYYSGGPAWCEAIAALGPTVLLNEHRLIEHGGARLLVAGVTDIGAGRQMPEHESDPHKAKAGAPAHDLSVLLAHQPRSIYGAAEAGFDLQLSGHTHAGQYFPMSLLIHLMQPYVSGLSQHAGSRTQIYVSRGTGYWGPPNRAGSPSEISLLTLRRA